ncbi:MAG: hypothetical protein Q9201_000301 [Fulgogasparrea decipioides]
MVIPDLYHRRVKATKHVSGEEDDASMISEFRSSSPPSDAPKDESSSECETGSQSGGGGDSIGSGADAATISFGALVKAQESLSKCSAPPKQNEFDSAEARERKAGKSDNREHVRSSKHAPAEMSSKKAVSRRREVVPTLKRDVRDPRFEPSSGPLNDMKAKKNYSFLEDYRDSEISQVKAGIRQTKDLAAKEKLKRALLSMESRKQSQQWKDQEQAVLRAHRTREKELVKQGKKPFYLKRGEQKKLALIQRFESMKGEQAEKVIERRRKKKAQRERKGMPEGRRAMNG